MRRQDMTTYIIKEVQNSGSDREGTMYTGTLRGAKIAASRRQAFQGTVLRIESEHGTPIAVKPAYEKWVNCE
jgi:hypothetical protein